MKDRLKLLGFVVVGLFLITSSQSFSEEETFRPKSEDKSLALSILGTVTPIASGFIIWALDDPEYEYKFNPITLQFDRYQKNPDHTLPIALILGGVAIGPSLGYFYGAPTLSNLKGLLIRSAVVGAAIWIVESDESNGYGGSPPGSTYVKRSSSLAPIFAITIGSVVVLVSAVNDIVKVKKRVREHNKKLLFKNSWNITPKYFAKSQALGLGIEMKF